MPSHPFRLQRRILAVFASLAVHAGLLGLLFAYSAANESAPQEVPNTEVALGSVSVQFDLVPPLPRTTARQPAGIELSEDVRITEPSRGDGFARPLAASGALPDLPPGGLGQAGQRSDRGATAAALALPQTPRSLVFLLDRSASMGLHEAWNVARRETLALLKSLPAATRFQVIPYNRQAEPLLLTSRLDLVAASGAAIQQVADALAALSPTGSTDHARALHRGLLLQPDVLLLMTDAGDLSVADVDAITSFNHGRTIIHTVEITIRSHSRPDNPLVRLAAHNQGTYRRLSPEAGLAAAP